MPYKPVGADETGQFPPRVVTKLNNTYGLKPDNGNRPVGKGELAINVEDYGAVGDGVTDDAAALQAAGEAAIAANLPLFIPSGTFKAGSPLLFDGNLSIQGTGTILSTHVTAATVRIRNATSGYIRDVTIKSTATVRDAVSRNIQLVNCFDFTVSGVKAGGGGSTGLFIEGGKRISVTGCTVFDTLADGIHITKGATFVSVTGNHVVNTGDDGIAVVSYLADGATCADITITGNTVSKSKARGITVGGGERVTISANTIAGTSSSGVILVEDTFYATYKCYDIIVSANAIVDAGQTLPRAGNGFGIELATGVLRAALTGNIIRNSYNRGIAITSPGTLVTANTVTLAGDSGISIGASKVTVLANHVYDSGRYGIVTAAALTDVVIAYNTVTDSNTTSAAGVDGINVGGSGAVTNATVVGNHVTDAANKTERAIEVLATGGTLRGNIVAGVTTISVTGGGSIERDTITSAADPTNLFYKTGTIHLNTATGVRWVFNGAVWLADNVYTSANGTKFRLGVSNDGALTTTSL